MFRLLEVLSVVLNRQLDLELEKAVVILEHQHITFPAVVIDVGEGHAGISQDKRVYDCPLIHHNPHNEESRPTVDRTEERPS